LIYSIPSSKYFQQIQKIVSSDYRSKCPGSHAQATRNGKEKMDFLVDQQITQITCQKAMRRSYVRRFALMVCVSRAADAFNPAFMKQRHGASKR
jgi:hypothetical protein